jgi:hypothetical protein
MCHPALAMRLTLHPQAFVFAAIRPKLQAHTLTFSRALIPLALVLLALTHILEFIYVHTHRFACVGGDIASIPVMME